MFLFKRKANVISFLLNISILIVGILNPASAQVSQGTKNIPLANFLDSLETHYDVYFMREFGVLEGSIFAYSPDILSKELTDIIEEIEELTPFKATKMSAEDDTTSFYSIRREDSKATIKGKVVDENNQPMPFANIIIPSLNIGASSKLGGKYELKLDAGKHAVIVSFLGKDDTEAIIDIGPGEILDYDFILEGSEYIDEVLIAGSRNAVAGLLAGGSTIIEHGVIASLINLRGKEIDSSVELSELLHIQQPSFHSVHQNVSDGTDHIDAATLRGMGPDQTLVLINGKRRHQSALLNISNTVGKGSVLTDLNTIPLSIIDRIEILQDGAASQYGSDAIAGVINIVLKENNYSEINLKTGVSEQGDGVIYDFASNFGFKLDERGSFLNVSINHYERDPTNRTLPYEGTILNPIWDSNQQNRDDFFGNNVYDSTKITRFGQSDIKSNTIFYNLKIPLNQSLELYSFGGYSYKKGGSVGVYRFPYQLRDPNLPNPWGFSPLLDTDITDKAFTIGINKVYKNAVLDISNTFGRNSITYKILDPTKSGGPGSVADVIAGEALYGQNISNIDYSHSLNLAIPVTLSAGAEIRVENYEQRSGNEALSSALDSTIVNVENENLQLFPRFGNRHSFSEYRTNIGIYFDVEADPSEELKVGLSGRFERYSDFGANLSWKVFARYNPSEYVSFKLSANTGFRAPSLHQYYYTSSLNQFVPSDKGGFKAVEVDHYNHDISNNSVLSDLGIQSLKSESSFNLNLGIITRPIKNLSIALNAYSINVDDRIILSGRLSGELNSEIAEAVDGSTDIQFFTNAIGTNTSGIEFVSKYRILFNSNKPKKNKSNSSLDLSFSGHLNTNRVNQLADSSTLVNLNGLLQPYENQIFNRSEVALFESSQPRSKFIFAASLHKGKFGFHTRLSRYGSVQYLHPLDGDESNWVPNENNGRVLESRDQTFSAKYLTDMSAQFSLTTNLGFTLGASNLFNVYPDEQFHSALRGSEMFPYSRFITQFGTRGAFYYANLNIKF